jgi:hypothetical protein
MSQKVSIIIPDTMPVDKAMFMCASCTFRSSKPILVGESAKHLFDEGSISYEVTHRKNKTYDSFSIKERSDGNKVS